MDAVTSYEELCEVGRLASQHMEQGRWDIGDIALLVQARYGQNTISGFAKDINVDVGRVKEYRTVCKFWEKSARTEYRERFPALSYSHFRTAMRMKKHGFEAACAFLEACGTEAWTVEQTRVKAVEMLGKPTPPVKLLDIEATVCGDDWQDWEAFVKQNIGKRVQIKVYELESETSNEAQRNHR